MQTISPGMKPALCSLLLHFCLEITATNTINLRITSVNEINAIISCFCSLNMAYRVNRSHYPRRVRRSNYPRRNRRLSMRTRR